MEPNFLTLKVQHLAPVSGQLLGDDHGVNDMDHTVVGHDVSGCYFGFIDHDATHGGDGDFRTL